MVGRIIDGRARKYWDGTALRAFWMIDGVERNYSAKVPRYDKNDELALDDDGSIKAIVKRSTNGVNAHVPGRCHKIGNRWQFVPDRVVDPSKDGENDAS